MITEISINKEKTSINLLDDKRGLLEIHTYGECCSESWFEHFEGVQNVLGAEILKIEEVGNGEVALLPHSPQERDLQYMVKIETTKGNAAIEMRNSSNGWYGGYILFLSSDEKDKWAEWIKKNTGEISSYRSLCCDPYAATRVSLTEDF